MKNAYLFIIIFLFSQCKKEELNPDIKYYGNASARLNGAAVNFNKARSKKFGNKTDSIGILLGRWEGIVQKESIGFGPIALTLNKPQRIYRDIYNENILSSTYSTMTADGDVVCDYYKVYEADSLQNFIVITSYNPQTKEIRGTFQATYLIDSARVASSGKCKPTAPDTLRIGNGTFYTKIF